MWSVTGWTLSVKRFFATGSDAACWSWRGAATGKNLWDTLPQAEMDDCLSNSFAFSVFGYNLHTRDRLAAGFFAGLPDQKPTEIM